MPSSGAITACCSQAAFSPSWGGGAAGAGCGTRPASQLGSAGYGQEGTGHGCGHGSHVKINVAKHGYSFLVRGGSAAASSGAPGSSGLGLGNNGNAIDLDNNNNNNINCND